MRTPGGPVARHPQPRGRKSALRRCFRHQVLLRGCGQWYRCGRDRVLCQNSAVPSINSSCMRLANFLQPECFGRLHVGRFKSRRRLCLLFIHPPAHGSEVSPAARNTLDSARIPRASKLLICGLFLKGRVLAQDGVDVDGAATRPAAGSWFNRTEALSSPKVLRSSKTRTSSGPTLGCTAAINALRCQPDHLAGAGQNQCDGSIFPLSVRPTRQRIDD